MKLTYHRSGDYLLPNLAVPDAPISLGKYGRMHAAYLKEHKPILYNNLLLSGKLTKHLAEVDTACQEYLETLLPQMMQQEGVDEQHSEPCRRTAAGRTGLRLKRMEGESDQAATFLPSCAVRFSRIWRRASFSKCLARLMLKP